MKTNLTFQGHATLLAIVLLACLATACVVTDKDRTPHKQPGETTSNASTPIASLDTTDITAPTYAVDTADTTGLSERMAEACQAGIAGGVSVAKPTGYTFAFRVAPCCAMRNAL